MNTPDTTGKDAGQSAESVPPVTTIWAHVLDDAGSADFYETEAEAREQIALWGGGGLDRIETTTVIPFSVTTPGGGA